MRYDEAFTVWRYAARSLRTVVTDYSLPNNHVFHTLAVHVAARLGGLDPWVVRLPALLAGVALAPTTFVLFARLASTSAGLLGAAFTAGSSVLIDYSVNARGYSLAAFLALLGAICAASIRSRQTTAPVLLLTLTLVSSVGLWTVPLFVYPFVATQIWLLLAGQPIRLRLFNATMVSVGTLVGTTLLYRPVLMSSGLSALTHNNFVAPDPWGVFADQLPGFLADVGRMWSVNSPSILVGIAIVGACTALADPGNRPMRALAWSLVGALIGITTVQHAVPYTRNWLVVLPLAIGISAAGVVTLVGRLSSPRRDMRLFFSIVSVATAIALLVAVEMREGTLSGESDGLVDAEAITLNLADRITPASHVALATPSTAPLWYYFLLHDLPRDPVLSPQSPPDRLFVVTALGQTVSEVLASDDLEAHRDVRVIARYPSGALWEVVVAWQ